MTIVSIPSIRGIVGSSQTIDVVVDSLDNGISGFVMSAEIIPVGIAKFIAVTYPGYGLTLTQPSPLDGPIITVIQAADLGQIAEGEIQNFTLFSLTIEFLEIGVAAVNVVINMFDDDDGFKIAATVRPGILEGSMSNLTIKELATLRRTIIDNEPFSFSTTDINLAIESIEERLDLIAFDNSSFIEEVVTPDIRAQKVKNGVDAGKVDVDLLPVFEDWLEDHPVSTTSRSKKSSDIDVWIAANKGGFLTLLGKLPVDIHTRTLRAILDLRIGKVV